MAELTASYIQTPPIKGNIPKSISDRIRELAADDPEKMAFVFRESCQPRVTLTRKELVDRVENLGKHFIKLGIQPRDRVATLLSTGINWIIVQFGLYFAGATAINSPSFDVSELEKIAGKLECVATVFEEALPASVHSKKENDKTKVITLKFILGSSSQERKVNLTNLMNNTDPGDTAFPEVPSDAEALMVCTSGSSGEPKLAIHTHASILTGAYSFAEGLQFNDIEMVAVDRPMNWMGGYPLYYLGSGCTTVYVSLQLDTHQEDDFFAEVLLSEKCPSAKLMEYKVNILIKMAALGKPLPVLKRGFTGGQRLTRKTAASLLTVCQEVAVGYASTECLQMIALLFQESQNIIEGTIGYPASGCKIKIVDDDEAVVEVGEEGELCIQSPACSKEYMYLDGTREKNKDSDGWYHTGDVCICQPDGLLIVRGRKTEMIKRATLKIFPALVEKVMRENLNIAEVAVVGIPDPVLHQNVCACIILKSSNPISIGDVRQRARDIFKPSLAPDGLGYMPGHFLMMDEFPQTKDGKWDRVELRKIATDRIMSL